MNLVERIDVHQDGEVEVTFRQQDQFTHILAFLQRKGARSNVVAFPQQEVS